MAILIPKDNNPTVIFDRHYQIRCPQCGVHSNVTCISPPRYEFLERFHPEWVAVGYRCDACNQPVHLKLHVDSYDTGNHRIWLGDGITQVERAQETFDFKYLPPEVEQDFRETLTCYSAGCFNAFAAMCRRCVQSSSSNLGAKGKDKVLAQLQDLKDTAQIDDETFGLLKQIVIDGHDGSHPHLPALSAERAAVLLELMKDVLYQLYVRRGKLQEAMALRATAIKAKKQE